MQTQNLNDIKRFFGQIPLARLQIPGLPDIQGALKPEMPCLSIVAT